MAKNHAQVGHIRSSLILKITNLVSNMPTRDSQSDTCLGTKHRVSNIYPRIEVDAIIYLTTENPQSRARKNLCCRQGRRSAGSPSRNAMCNSKAVHWRKARGIKRYGYLRMLQTPWCQRGCLSVQLPRNDPPLEHGIHSRGQHSHSQTFRMRSRRDDAR